MKKISIIILPTLFWFVLATIGFGAQSLANLIEVVVVIFVSLLALFIPTKKVSLKYILIILFIMVFLLRLFMPIIPE